MVQNLVSFHLLSQAIRIKICNVLISADVLLLMYKVQYFIVTEEEEGGGGGGEEEEEEIFRRILRLKRESK